MPKISAMISMDNGEDFRNQSVVLTGQEPMCVVDFLKMLAEILGLPESVEVVEGDYVGHYNRSP
jgi:UDP-glucose 4-epimerase